MKNTILFSAIVSCALFASCEKAPETSSAPASPASDALQQVFAVVPEGEATSIHLARTSAKPGDGLTLKGLVMGNAKPFVEGRAVFVLGDPEKITPCNAIPGDNCPTPWDACCDAPENLKAGTATIQVVDGSGQPLRESIENVGGLKPLSSVVVSGTVAEGSSEDLLLLNARAILVSEPPKS